MAMLNKAFDSIAAYAQDHFIAPVYPAKIVSLTTEHPTLLQYALRDPSSLKTVWLLSKTALTNQIIPRTSFEKIELDENESVPGLASSASNNYIFIGISQGRMAFIPESC